LPFIILSDAFSLQPFRQVDAYAQIAYSKGGLTETVIENKTGVYFTEQTESSIIAAVNYFESNLHLFNPVEIAKHASLYSSKRFKKELSDYLSKIIR
jgi:hypothetical protein